MDIKTTFTASDLTYRTAMADLLAAEERPTAAQSRRAKRERTERIKAACLAVFFIVASGFVWCWPIMAQAGADCDMLEYLMDETDEILLWDLDRMASGNASCTAARRDNRDAFLDLWAKRPMAGYAKCGLQDRVERQKAIIMRFIKAVDAACR